MAEAVKHLWTSSGPTAPIKQGHLEQILQD